MTHASIVLLTLSLSASTLAQAPAANPPAKQDAVPPSAAPKVTEDVIRTALSLIPRPNDSYGAALATMVESFPAYQGDGQPITEDLVIHATDATAVLFMELGRAWTKVNSDSTVTVHQTIADGNMQELERNDGSILAIARPIAATVADRLHARGGEVQEVPFARDGVAFFVHIDNPLAGLTRVQCNGIVSATHTICPRLILKWNDLDPSSPLGETPFPLYMLDAKSATMQRVVEWCMPGEPITTIGTFIEPSASSVVNACCAYRTAMGIASTGARQPRARMLPIAAEDNAPFVAPSVLTIADGSYPLARSLRLVFITPKGTEVPRHIRQFLRFIWSEDGQDIVAQLKLVPPDIAQILPQLGTPDNNIWK